jgi:hypothetical protein
MPGIDRKQIMLLHVLRSKILLTEEDYRAALSSYGVESSTDLTHQQAAELIARFESQATQMGVWKRDRRRSKKERVDDRRFSPRTGPMATTKQIDKIEALWSTVSFVKSDEARRAALDSFIHRRFHRGGLMMVERELVYKVVHAIEEMAMNEDRKRERRELRELIAQSQETEVDHA